MADDPTSESRAEASSVSGASPPPGWYADPERPGHTRWWDGTTWGITDAQWGGAGSSEPGAPVPPSGASPQVVYVQAPQAVSQKTNGFAIASMVLGIIWIWWIGSILALVFGYIARNQIRRSGGTQGGNGMAVAGIVLGWIGVGILILLIVLALAST